MMNISAIKQRIRAVKAAEEDLSSEVANQFPIGVDVTWKKHGHWQHGPVLHLGNTGRLRVENAKSGKRYWIGMYDVVGYVESPGREIE